MEIVFAVLDDSILQMSRKILDELEADMVCAGF